MTFRAKSTHPRNGGRTAAVVLMVSLWVAMCALEVSPDLHHFIHKDARNPAHNCLVTQFQHHTVLSGFVPAVTPALPDATCSLLAGGDFQFRPSYDYRLTPSRAPPAV